MKQPKQELISFKVDESLMTALSDIPNRSEFIRSTLIAALDGACPLCNGTGILNMNQKKHWQEFINNHSLVKCETCQEKHLVCSNQDKYIPIIHKNKG